MFTIFYPIIIFLECFVPTNGIARCQTYLITPPNLLNDGDVIAKSYTMYEAIFSFPT
jgi:hypothetical protein